MLAIEGKEPMLAIEGPPKKEKKKKKGAQCPWNMKEKKCNNRPGCAFDKTKNKCVRDTVMVKGKPQEIGLGSVDDLAEQLKALKGPEDMIESDMIQSDMMKLE